jgi:hypothetical protein
MPAGAADGGRIEVHGDGYAASAFITDKLVNEKPGDPIQRAHLGMGRIILFTEWRELEPRLYREQIRVFDPLGALRGSWQFEFIPAECLRHNTWDWWQFFPYQDSAGTWIFEVDIDGRRAFDGRIAVEAAE